eukprot:TRINITY_DN12108_c0_g1_i1.p1 TRINITY_DN12108_c0_g1~~TRINITY_DN12108_c0_g1_i1.p1  ORF type:complete len:101 (+),score=41.03 TRINITY_DN12108_c0_g1_i1:203-505(+)
MHVKEVSNKHLNQVAKEGKVKNHHSQVYNTKLLAQEARLRMTTTAEVDAEAHLEAALVSKRRHQALMAKSSKPVTRLTVCLLYTSPSPRDRTRSRMPSSA